MRFADSCPAILSIGTAVPPYQITQDDSCTWVSDSLPPSSVRR
jgi:hypothetical protein